MSKSLKNEIQEIKDLIVNNLDHILDV